MSKEVKTFGLPIAFILTPTSVHVFSTYVASVIQSCVFGSTDWWTCWVLFYALGK